jgi:transcription elongation factor GreA
MGYGLPRRDPELMAENAFLQPDTNGPAAIQVTETEYAALLSELETLRASHRAELAERLRHARDFGPAAENDDLHAVLEDAAIDRARIARLEEVLRLASVVEQSDAVDGAAGLGSSVLVEDELGATARYALIGRRRSHSARHEITPGSPMGKALNGARSGNMVHVELPSGRVRQLRVLEVRPAAAHARSAAADAQVA